MCPVLHQCALLVVWLGVCLSVLPACRSLCLGTYGRQLPVSLLILLWCCISTSQASPTRLVSLSVAECCSVCLRPGGDEHLYSTAVSIWCRMCIDASNLGCIGCASLCC